MLSRDWKKNFKLGVEELDKDHQQFFETMDQFLENLEKEDNQLKKQEAKKLITSLKDHFIQHLKKEEELQQQINYSNYQDHKRTHEILLKRIDEVISIFNVEKSETGDFQLLYGEISSLLASHIMYLDQDIANYIKYN